MSVADILSAFEGLANITARCHLARDHEYSMIEYRANYSDQSDLMFAAWITVSP
jgi:hypothetical protein